MPCRTDDYFESKSPEVSLEKYNNLKKEADEVTRLLCSVMKEIERHKFPAALSPNLGAINGLSEWWEHHKEVDRKRIEAEVVKAEKSLSGLSKEAKELLIKNLQNSK